MPLSARRALMKREQMGSVHDADIWQPFRAAIVPVQQAVQLGFQVPWPPLTHAGKPRPAGSDSRKRRLCCCNVWTAWGNGATAGEAIWITAPDRVLQAALMKRLHKPVETACAVMHQKPGVVLSQNRSRLGIPTVRLNHVNCDLFAQQNPQILRAGSHSPTGVVQPYDRALRGEMSATACCRAAVVELREPFLRSPSCQRTRYAFAAESKRS